ncbi:MAG: glycosyl hydrolase [Candidatus Epulonipiscioides saccharophilum]|nr:MAG: glycosyl hydrolase [Epulopiscium sp. AS2M-Bin001]
MKIITTTRQLQWQELSTSGLDTIKSTLSIKDAGQLWDGFGGCFNELSQIALLKLPEDQRKEVYDFLFSKNVDGLKFDFCRIPIGASDYAEFWYSHNETDGDYEMKNFSIERDHKYLLPYIKEALKRNPSMKFFASPWSPPAWMKYPKAHNNGTLLQTDENLKAYALYLALFIEAYEKEGVTIHQLHIQNEPVSSQKFPSCIWTGEEFSNFIANYLGPIFKERNIKTKIWLGTLNGPETDNRKLYTRYDNYANLVLHDEEAYPYIEGVSYQWAGKYALEITRSAFPEKKYMQTENECGDGTNSWNYAMYIFEMFHHYISNGVCAYIYWNMALPPGGASTWGWHQNSMIDITSEHYKFNYEYYVMKHFAAFIQVGAQLQILDGHFNATSICFKNPDNSLVLISKNPFEREVEFEFEGQTIILPPFSINTILF